MVDFQMTEVEGLMSVDIKTIDGIVPAEDAPKEFPHTYLVLMADKDCLLVSYAMTNNGWQRCLLWGLSGNNVSQDTECYKARESFCPPDMYDMTETDGPCQQFDRDDDRLNKKAEEEKETR
ncbi:uncharacterized protein LOC142569019 [Dermacentor variabilis]|uniref:uncharacterized protein LOC142569019 n=1 Tax=Dermacentor variabilis TaxID=34621 RepID=UPI003F5CA119